MRLSVSNIELYGDKTVIQISTIFCESISRYMDEMLGDTFAYYKKAPYLHREHSLTTICIEVLHGETNIEGI